MPQTKSVTEDSGAEASSSISTPAQEALIAEAAKILKGVALKPLSVSEDLLEAAAFDRGWLMGAISSASDPQYALVDSGATNALRSAREEELLEAKVIKVDLASGGTELHINKHGTLLSSGPCQVILPAGYLVQLGFTIGWKKKGCVIQRRGKAVLEVKVVKGCPLIPKERGLQLLDEYEGLLESGKLPALRQLSQGRGSRVKESEARKWLASKVAGGCLTRQDQLDWLSAMFPETPDAILQGAAGIGVAGVHGMWLRSPGIVVKGGP